MKFLCTAILLHCSLMMFAGNVVDEMLKAYGSLNCSKARRLAGQIPEEPESRLVFALCQIFDPANSDIKVGLDSLKKLYDDDNLPLNVWSQAALSYGRVAQLIHKRKELYGDLGSGVNPHEVFQSVIEKVPESRDACTALFFELSDDFESPDKKKVDSAFEKLEKFCINFKGKPEYLAPLHLLADQKYIELKKNYSFAVKHLEQAYELSIANPRDAEITLYRIGRIYDLKLDNKKNAEEYYSRFLKAYPESGYAPAAKRFLNALSLKKEENKNGQK